VGSHFQSIIERVVGAWLYGYEVKTDYRPEWMHGLELDIYFPELRLAIEVQGEQHFQDIPGMGSWGTQRGRDLDKIELCKKLNISLVWVTLKKLTIENLRLQILAWSIDNPKRGAIKARISSPVNPQVLQEFTDYVSAWGHTTQKRGEKERIAEQKLKDKARRKAARKSRKKRVRIRQAEQKRARANHTR